jgi:hypothetical protein
VPILSFFLYFNDFLSASHKLEIINLGSKKINHINLRFHNIMLCCDELFQWNIHDSLQIILVLEKVFWGYLWEVAGI